MDLCTFDQMPSQHYSILESSQGRQSGSADGVFDAEFFQNSASTRRAPVSEKLGWTASNMIQSGEEQRQITFISSHRSLQSRALSMEVHIARMREAREQLFLQERRAEREARHREALRWISENRTNFAGRWVALRGSDLLAVGSNAKEVYQRVAGTNPPALIVRIETEDVPFGGW